MVSDTVLRGIDLCDKAHSDLQGYGAVLTQLARRGVTISGERRFVRGAATLMMSFVQAFALEPGN